MAGLLGIGIAMLLGIGMRIGAASGFALYMLMYLAAFPMTTNPILDDHVIMAVLLIALAGSPRATTWGGWASSGASSSVRRLRS